MVDRQTEVIEFCNDGAEDYAIFSYQWGVKYEEIVGLAKMEPTVIDEARQSNGREVRVDISCVDKRSSAESSEAINSMYRVFSRGWTLQEMIALNGLQFFNKDWRPIADKKTLAPTLAGITQVLHILMGGPSRDLEHRAYLMGLLSVNMYEEGKKACQYLCLEIICMSNNQCIFVCSSIREIRNIVLTRGHWIPNLGFVESKR
ncbi:hypothetical protein V8B97DRAFT_2020720 [Scleroderma yunnanense]